MQMRMTTILKVNLSLSRLYCELSSTPITMKIWPVRSSDLFQIIAKIP